MLQHEKRTFPMIAGEPHLPETNFRGDKVSRKKVPPPHLIERDALHP
jgi:hypothetical protein